jgi:hypothetical protein
MTRESDIKKVLAPLARRRADLFYKRRRFFLTPIRHVIRAVVIRPSYWGPGPFYVHWGMALTFEPTAPLGWPLLPEVSRGAGWDVSAPGIAERVWDLMEAEALPPLDRIGSLDELDRFLEGRPQPTYGWQRYSGASFLLAVARGNFGFCDEYLDGPFGYRTGYAAEKQRAETLAPLISARDRAGIARLLHEWEAFRIKALKLEKYWEPTPFPVESEG